MEGSTYTNSYIVLLLTVLIFNSNKILASASRATPNTNTEFIRTSCISTLYPRLCFTSLLIHASTIQTSPKLLAHTALWLTFNTTKSMSSSMMRLSHSHNLSPKELGPMQDCVEELGDSVDQLRKSLMEMAQLKGSNYQLMINDIQTWVSAALTDDDTCMDGFGISAMRDNLKNVVRGMVVNIAQLTSNALVLINNFASIHG